MAAVRTKLNDGKDAILTSSQILVAHPQRCADIEVPLFPMMKNTNTVDFH